MNNFYLTNSTCTQKSNSKTVIITTVISEKCSRMGFYPTSLKYIEPSVEKVTVKVLFLTGFTYKQHFGQKTSVPGA